ncbi:DNA repair protein RecN [Pseudomarimonas salicorniae]|uniref:DNA repair protein RecN n=1 Tax=Pseudomarimonas salicorniae TaxID=2933270 RepID=A0ABT0GEZ7_9GAMM|nr:DNA repair protein RecN [Lysobacter sp. CAU 1642]MCK7593119.1 DNA repair protein RecN [Lysobacter sp. CAU 1642]
MLTRLYLKDFAIATAVDFDLQKGLGVISGETGAGKSLLVDALLLLSGSRADPGVVRHGADRAELGAEFLIDSDSPARAWLRERELDDESRCLLRRVIRADGGSRAWINGSPATAGQLGELAGMLIEIHGQHEHQALLDRVQQLRLLDGFGGHEALAAAVLEAHRLWRARVDERDGLEGGGDPAQRIDYLRHQLAQLDALSLDPEHIESLTQRQRRLAAAQQIAEALESAQQRLAEDGTGGARGALLSARHALERVTQHLPALEDTVALLDTASIQLDEAALQLERCAGDLELDADSAQAVERELSDLHELARRHRVRMEELADLRDRLREELERLEDLDGRRERIDREIAAAAEAWTHAAGRLTAARQKTAARLGTEVSALMEELGMSGGRLLVELSPQAGPDPHPAGAERAELCVSANAGQPPRPLRKVASGGELSRISLAIEVATFGGDGVPTMVFDEVDSGIGGAIAEVVGLKLRALAAHRQVLCVTHLPQVAAQGHYQFQVSKRIEEGVTRSQLRRLDASGRVEELARMLGGLEITDTTLAHARQMLAQAASNP